MGQSFKGPARSSHLSFRILRVRTVWKTIQYRWGTDARGGPRKRCARERACTHARTHVYTSKGVYATRARTASRHSRTHAGYVRGARKRLEKGRMWSRRRRARQQVTPLARSPSHRRYYTRYDGKLALTVSAMDFRLAPLGNRAFGFESGAFREKCSPKGVSSWGNRNLKTNEMAPLNQLKKS